MKLGWMKRVLVDMERRVEIIAQMALPIRPRGSCTRIRRLQTSISLYDQKRVHKTYVTIETITISYEVRENDEMKRMLDASQDCRQNRRVHQAPCYDAIRSN